MRIRPDPHRREVWLANLDPIVGHVQAGRRPVIVVSVDPFNQSGSRLVIVVPLTRTDRRNPFHVPIVPPDGNLRYPSFALCEMVRSISTDRLQFRIGVIDQGSMAQIVDRLRVLLRL